MIIPGLIDALTPVFREHNQITKIAIRTTCKHDGTLNAKVMLSKKKIATTVAQRMNTTAHKKTTYAMMEASVGMPDVVPANVGRAFINALDRVVQAAGQQEEFINGARGRETFYEWSMINGQLMNREISQVELRVPPPVPEGVAMDLNEPVGFNFDNILIQYERPTDVAPVPREIQIRPEDLTKHDSLIDRVFNKKSVDDDLE